MDKRRLQFLPMAYSRLRNIWYLLRKGKWRNAYSYLWSTALTRDSGVALLDGLWRKLPRLSPYPEAIEIEVTTKCHLRCVMCEQVYWKEPGRNMSYQQFETIMRQFPHLKWIGLTGIGSSFLNPDFMKMLEYLKRRGVYIEFFDTFDLITPEIAERLVELNIDKIWLSCEAVRPQTYEKIRVGAKFEKILKNVKAFLEIKKRQKALIPEVWFHYIINRYNVEEISPYVDFVADLMRGVPQSAVMIFYTGMMAFKEVADLQVRDIPGTTRQSVYEKAQKYGFYINWNENLTCEHGPSYCTKWTEPFILSSGHIQPCCVLNEANDRDFQRNNAFMNVFEGDFREYWRSQKFKGFLDTLHQNKFPAVCKNCKVYRKSK